MKRLILTFSALFTVFWLMPMFSQAYSPELEYVLDWLDTTGSTYTTSWCDKIESDWTGNRQLLIYAYNPPTNRETFISYDGYPFTVNGTSVTMYQRYIINDNSNTSSVQYNTRTLTDGGDNGLIKYFGTRDNVAQNLIDYDNVYYSPLIPNVEFSVVLNTSGVPVNDINSEYNAFNVNVKSNVGTNYYIQIGYKAHVPKTMALGVNNNGTPYYSAITYNAATYQNVYSLSDKQVAFTGNVNNSLFTWTRQSVQSSDWVIASSLDGQTSFVNGSISSYNDSMSYVMPLYGKKIEIFMRYFVIQDGQVIVGAWSHWNNTYPKEYTQELPSNYIPYHDVPGLEQTNNNTEYQNSSDSISTIGQTTGQTNVSVYNSNVPNYPDYPTAVTYNHDNILTQMIETTQKLPSFFGEFTGFCKECMTILPAEIWEVIAFGFMCSILVMIVKVL